MFFLYRALNLLFISSVFFLHSLFGMNESEPFVLEAPPENLQDLLRASLDKVIIAPNSQERVQIRAELNKIYRLANPEIPATDGDSFFTSIKKENIDKIRKQCAVYKKNGLFRYIYNEEGETPLFVAIQEARILAVMALLNQKVNLNQENRDALLKRPIDAALDLQDSQMAAVMVLILLDWGAEVDENDSYQIQTLLSRQRARILQSSSIQPPKNTGEVHLPCHFQNLLDRPAECSHDEKQAQTQSASFPVQNQSLSDVQNQIFGSPLFPHFNILQSTLQPGSNLSHNIPPIPAQASEAIMKILVSLNTLQKARFLLDWKHKLSTQAAQDNAPRSRKRQKIANSSYPSSVSYPAASPQISTSDEFASGLAKPAEETPLNPEIYDLDPNQYEFPAFLPDDGENDFDKLFEFNEDSI